MLGSLARCCRVAVYVAVYVAVCVAAVRYRVSDRVRRACLRECGRASGRASERVCECANAVSGDELRDWLAALRAACGHDNREHAEESTEILPSEGVRERVVGSGGGSTRSLTGGYWEGAELWGERRTNQGGDALKRRESSHKH
eukprot:6188107-Pleurochrysis_carterae.AAC.1